MNRPPECACRGIAASRAETACGTTAPWAEPALPSIADLRLQVRGDLELEPIVDALDRARTLLAGASEAIAAVRTERGPGAWPPAGK